MLAVAEARERILDGLRPTAAEVVALAEAWGRVSAQSVVARLTQPPSAVSAMDGYAARAADAAAGATLAVAGAAPAGHPWGGTLGPGQAVRVFTGSVLPAGADAVVLQEQAASDGERVTLDVAAAPGRHIRAAGQDFAVGDVLVVAGRRLSARDIGLAAAGNHPWLAVHRQPRVGILATGDEIVLPGEALPRGGIVSSNSHMLAAMIRAAGGLPCLLPIAADDRAALARAIEAAIDGLDLLVTSGGASVGEHDLVRETLQASGMELGFWKVAMRPGKPLLHGRLRGRPVIGLPGNPVSAMVTALLFVLPAIERLTGLPGDGPATEAAGIGLPLAANDERADHLRATLAPLPDGTLEVRPFPRQDSAMLRLLAQADALVLRPPHAPALAVGATVPIIRLDRYGL